jgi:hypothetical protein
MGLGIKGIKGKGEDCSVGFRASSNTAVFGLTGEMVGPFIVSSPSKPRLGGRDVVAFRRDDGGKGGGGSNGGGNGGGNFPWRKPLAAGVPNSSCSSLVSIGSVELDLTSERNSRSLPERVKELREVEDDERDRENLLRKRETAEGADDGDRFSS